MYGARGVVLASRLRCLQNDFDLFLWSDFLFCPHSQVRTAGKNLFKGITVGRRNKRILRVSHRQRYI
jgi:hypothetical protein